MEKTENKEKQIWNYYKAPINMEMLMDGNCSQVWNVLKGLSFFNRSNTFNVTTKYLETVTGLSKKVINAVLSAFHRREIITVNCVGIGVSKTPNQITINTKKFWDYDSINPTELLTGCTDMRIVTDKYKEKGYKVSYLQDNEEENEDISTGLPTTEENDFVATITSAETITDSDVDDIFQEEKVSVAPATATPPAEIEPVKVEYNSIAIPKNKEGWFDLLNTLKYKIIDTDDPTNFLSKNYGLIEKLCSVYGFKNPQMTYSDSKPMYEYCMNKNYI